MVGDDDDSLDTPTEWAELGVSLGELDQPPSQPQSQRESPLTEYRPGVQAPVLPVYARDSREVSPTLACFTVDSLAVAMKHHCASPELDDLISLLRQCRIHQQAFCALVAQRFGPDVLINALHEICIAVYARQAAGQDAAERYAADKDAAEEDKQGPGPEPIKSSEPTPLMAISGEPQLPPRGLKRKSKRPIPLELPSRPSKSFRPKQLEPDELFLEPLCPCPISALKPASPPPLSFEPISPQPCAFRLTLAHAAAA
eukprot:CAMPEP_0174733216 /NCGR_PEP_ID=MMETSP1094-20130205/60874_1 /TAXON_ID=156173 /ORGANISM="Chrysochromulina brevifilum, Strain UTEX LB 985" /LENGTH=256 /DNA_ID=CAMNT_0015935841 /DNA_START=60 /DNA_END=830 /DNA_ORIENTATION=+